MLGKYLQLIVVVGYEVDVPMAVGVIVIVCCGPTEILKLRCHANGLPFPLLPKKRMAQLPVLI